MHLICACNILWIHTRIHVYKETSVFVDAKERTYLKDEFIEIDLKPLKHAILIA